MKLSFPPWKAARWIFGPRWLMHRLGLVSSQNVPLALDFILTSMIITQEELSSIRADEFYRLFFPLFPEDPLPFF